MPASSGCPPSPQHPRRAWRRGGARKSKDVHLNPVLFSKCQGTRLPHGRESPPPPSFLRGGAPRAPAGQQLPPGLLLRLLRHSVPCAVQSALDCSLQPALTCLHGESSIRGTSVGRLRGPENRRKGYPYSLGSSYFSPNCCREAAPGPSPPPGEPRGPAGSTATQGPADSVRAVSELSFCPVGAPQAVVSGRETAAGGNHSLCFALGTVTGLPGAWLRADRPPRFSPRLS